MDVPLKACTGQSVKGATFFALLFGWELPDADGAAVNDFALPFGWVFGFALDVRLRVRP